MAKDDSVFTRLRKLKRPEGLSDSGRLLREVVRARLLDATTPEAAAPAAFHLDDRRSIAQLESEDMVRRLRRANVVGILMWPPFVVLDLIVSHGRPDALPWLIGLRAAAWAICVTMFPDTSWRNLVRQVTEEQPEPPSRRLGEALPAELEAIVMRCLEKTPQARFDSAAELGAALSALRS